MSGEDRPLLLVDVDGVIALFGFGQQPPAGRWRMIEGIAYYLAQEPAQLLHAAAEHFELVWCTGWEERANDHLPRLAGTPGPLPVIRFARNPGRANAHWKLPDIDAFVGARPVAWIDDTLSAECEHWAAQRSAAGSPTLLVQTDPAVGMRPAHLAQLVDFALSLRPKSHGAGEHRR